MHRRKINYTTATTIIASVLHQNIEHFDSNSDNNRLSSRQTKRKIENFYPKFRIFSQILHLRGKSNLIKFFS